MKSKKEILILCDTHDFIRHESYNYFLLKQLYVFIYLLKVKSKKNELNIYVNNRSELGFEVFFEKKTKMGQFLDEYIETQKWDQIEFSKYDIIICLPAYQRRLITVQLNYPTIEFYSFQELQFLEEKLFDSASSVFIDGTHFSISQEKNLDQKLINFKSKFDRSLKKISIHKLEKEIGLKMNLFNSKLPFNNLKKLMKVIILDDFQRPFFIGDSVYWFAKLRKLCSFFEDHTQIDVNILNKNAYNNIETIFLKSLPPNIHFINKDWDKIDFLKYNLVLCNNDIQFKFHWYINNNPDYNRDEIPTLTFSVMDERKISSSQTLDFYSILFKLGYKEKLKKTNQQYDQQKFIGLPIQKEESLWAKTWFNERGILENNEIIIIFHGASAKNKVIEDIELLKLLNLLNTDPNVKIILLTHKVDEEHKELRTSIYNNSIFNHVVIGDSLNIRDLMGLLVQPNISLILGPCTGHLHLTDGIFTHLLETGERTKKELPLILVYAGKQSSERNYHPSNWWKHSKNVECCVALKYCDGSQYLTKHNNSPQDLNSFNESSIFANEIKAETLLNYIKNDNLERTNSIKNNTSPIESIKIPTCIINLKSRVERKNYILNQFSGKKIFDLKIYEAVLHQNGRIGLWKTITNIIQDALTQNFEFVLLCEDDHKFTDNFSEQILLDSIHEAKLLNSDMLLGGICSYKNCNRISSNLISVKEFACTQFTIIFKKMYTQILNTSFTENDCADFKLSQLTDKKYVIFPFISIQRDFGYSDVSDGYFENKMDTFFNQTSRLININLSETIKYKA